MKHIVTFEIPDAVIELAYNRRLQVAQSIKPTRRVVEPVDAPQFGLWVEDA